MTPYYADDHVTLYHARWEDVPHDLLRADVLVTDPPYGVGKASWDGEFAAWEGAAQHVSKAVGLMPGNSNIGRCPESVSGMLYRWTLAAHITNALVRGATGFGNWIPLLMYAADGVSIFSQKPDVRDFAIQGAMPDHPSPKPYHVMRWFVSMLPDGTILDPYAGSGTTLVAAKSLGRKAIGVECVERYCEVAANRLRQEVIGLVA